MKDDDIFLFFIFILDTDQPNSGKAPIDSKYFLIRFLEVRTTTYSTFHFSLRVQVPAQLPDS